MLKKYSYKIYRYLTIGNYNILDNDWYHDYLEIINNKFSIYFSHDTFKPDLYRSISQYKCQRKLSPIWKNLFLDLISIIVFFFIFPLIVLSVLYDLFQFSEKTNSINSVIVEKIDIDLLSEEIQASNQIINNESKLYFDKNIFIYFLKIFPYICFKPYFLLKIIYKFSEYSGIIRKSNPTKIFTYSEYSFCSSILTFYLENRNIQHIYFMDGDKLLNVKSSFFRFSKALVWNQHYIDLFLKLKAFKNQFEIYKPKKHIDLINENLKMKGNKGILKYFWAVESKVDTLNYIKDNLSRIKKQGVRVIVRAHPYHIDKFNQIVLPILKDFEIEYPNQKKFIDSFCESEMILSSYSTTLYEASLCNKIVLINDFKDNLKKLRKLGFPQNINSNIIPLSDFNYMQKI